MQKPLLFLIKAFIVLLLIQVFLAFTNGLGFNYSELNALNFIYESLMPITRLMDGDFRSMVLDLFVLSALISIFRFGQMKIHLLIILVASTLICLPWISEFIAIDKCLDLGGSWNYLTDECVTGK